MLCTDKKESQNIALRPVYRLKEAKNLLLLSVCMLERKTTVECALCNELGAHSSPAPGQQWVHIHRRKNISMKLLKL